MKVDRLFTALLLLLACSPLGAQSAKPDPLADSLFPPELIMQNAEAIGLTREQREFIQSEMQKVQERFADMQRKLQNEVESTAALLKKDRVDEAAALAQVDKVLDQEREIKRAHLALVLAFKNKLTPEQQARLQELKKQSARTSERLPAAIPEKMKKVQAAVKQWQEDGRDPSSVGELMQGFEPLMKEGNFKEAEKLLDKALGILRGEEKKSEADGQKRASAPPSLQASEKSPEALAAEIQSLQPMKLVWREIQWRHCLLEGLAEARSRRKPVILWAFINSSPCDERC